MSSSEPILSEFLTKEELAAELRRNPRTLDRWEVLAWGRRGRVSDVRCFIGERACRNGSSRKSSRSWDVRYDGRCPEARDAPNLPFARLLL